MAEFPDQLVRLKGLGFMIGLEVKENPRGYVAELRNLGLLAPPAGGNVVRLLPPLNATADELTRSVEIFRRVLAAKS